MKAASYFIFLQLGLSTQRQLFIYSLHWLANTSCLLLLLLGLSALVASSDWTLVSSSVLFHCLAWISLLSSCLSLFCLCLFASFSLSSCFCTLTLIDCLTSECSISCKWARRWGCDYKVAATYKSLHSPRTMYVLKSLLINIYPCILYN